MALMSRCFCCFSLRSGMLTLGWVQGILSVLSLCLVIVLNNSSTTILYVLLGGSVIQAIAAGCLLFGVYRRKSTLVYEYVKLETLLHVASLLEFLVYLALKHSTFSSDQIYTFLAFLAVNYGVAVYYLLAAYSYYQTMTDAEQTPLIQT